MKNLLVIFTLSFLMVAAGALAQGKIYKTTDSNGNMLQSVGETGMESPHVQGMSHTLLERIIHIKFNRVCRHPQTGHFLHFQFDVAIDEIIAENSAGF